MAKVQASQNKAADVETKTEAVVAVLEKPAEEAPAYTEAKKVNAEFDKKMSGETEVKEEVVADDNSGDDKNKADDDDSAGEAETKVEAETVEDEIPAETAQVDEEAIKTLFERAEAVGLTQKQVESFSSAEDLENTLEILESRHKEKQPEKPAKTEVVEDDKPFDCGLDPEKYDEGLIKAVNKMGNDFKAEMTALKKENAALKATTDSFSEKENRKAAKEHLDWFDGQLNSLEGFEDVFGKGTIKDIEKGSAEWKNRAVLDKTMFTIAKGYEAAGEKIPSKNELFQLALNMKFVDKIKSAVIAGAGKKLDKRVAQTLGRGSGKGAPMTAIDKAKQANSDFDKEHLA